MHFRDIAPDLLGLGDTIVRLDDDHRLPNQVGMVVALLDQLKIGRAHFVGHDHGGAIVQLKMNFYVDRLSAVVLTNVEAYDQWPSDGPAIAERLARHIPGVVRTEWLTNSAHLSMLEEPEQYASAIERFLSNPSGHE